MSATINYSVVIPIYNEEQTISQLWKRLNQTIKHIEGCFEIIFVDDGSFDDSLALLIELASMHHEIKIISLSRNFGHQQALSAGIDYAMGEAAILMDSDLQDSPETIPLFIEKWKDGNDVVYAIRTNRKEHWLKKLAFKTFYFVQSKLVSIQIPRDVGIFSLLDRKVINALRQMPERNKYISGLRSYAGFKQVGIVVERGARYHDTPRVTIAKLVKLAFDGIFSFSTIPLKFATMLGFIIAITAFIVGLVGLYYKFILMRELWSWGYGLTTTFFLGGVQLIFLGILGEYIGRIYEEVKRRPYYIIGRKIGFDD